MKFRMALVVVSLLLSIAIGLMLGRRGALPASRSGGGGDAPIVIGLSMDTEKEARWQKDRDVFTARARELGAQVKTQSANSDDTRQIQDVKSLLANHVDVLVIIPHDGDAMAEGVREAAKAGVPVIAYDRLIRNCDLDLYLSFDNVKVGEMQARYLVEHLPGGKGRIVRIYGAPTDNNAKIFKQGQDQVLAPLIARGDIEVVHEDWATDWDSANAKKIMNAALTRASSGFDAVLASNDGTAGGAIQALKEAGLAGKVIVTGQDADLVACQRIAAGQQAMTVYKPIQNLATRAAELAVTMARGKPVIANGAVANGQKDVPAVLLDIVSVDKDNLRQTIVAGGFHSEAEVFGAP
ncbi:MAG: substrate-binding domain-containing protein [Lentisphaerae bacterium]|nr:substrate-binding domain-containing protein [Lentisphaerota bacterium]